MVVSKLHGLYVGLDLRLSLSAVWLSGLRPARICGAAPRLQRMALGPSRQPVVSARRPCLPLLELQRSFPHPLHPHPRGCRSPTRMVGAPPGPHGHRWRSHSRGPDSRPTEGPPRRRRRRRRVVRPARRVQPDGLGWHVSPRSPPSPCRCRRLPDIAAAAEVQRTSPTGLGAARGFTVFRLCFSVL